MEERAVSEGEKEKKRTEGKEKKKKEKLRRGGGINSREGKKEERKIRVK